MISELVSITAGLSGTAIAIFFMKRFVGEFDAHKKEITGEFVKLKQTVNDPVGKLTDKYLELTQLVNELKAQQKIDIGEVRVILQELKNSSAQFRGAQLEVAEDAKRLTAMMKSAEDHFKVYDSVIRKLITEIRRQAGEVKKLEEDHSSFRVKIMEDLLILKKKN